MPLILASTSRYRAELLRRLGIDFTTVAPHVDETVLADEAPRACAIRLAAAKARAVAQDHAGRCVIGSDQVAEFDGAVLGKPGTRERARAQLQRFSGQTVAFHTALCVIDAQAGQQSAIDTTTVTFRPLSQDEIERYLDREQVLDCAGSFRSEGLGISLFERVQSDDPSALIGLPLIATARLLRAAGYELP